MWPRRRCRSRSTPASPGRCATATAAALDELEDETEDRFGPPPEPLGNLFALAQLALRCRRIGVARLEAGPQAVAATMRGMPAEPTPGLEVKGDRVILRRPGPDAAARMTAARALLDALEGP
jgi:transcription-repair coupling factor (superfamily II helicase)